MNKKGKLIILIVILIVVIIAILLINSKNSESKNNIIISNEYKLDEDIRKNTNMKQVTNTNMYFTVKYCAEKYIYYLQLKDKKSLETLLDNNYINRFNITQDNILNYVEKIDSMGTLFIDKMYVINEDDEIQTYYLEGNIIQDMSESNYEYNEDRFCITIILDTNNDIYSVIPFGYGGPLYEKK